MLLLLPRQFKLPVTVFRVPGGQNTSAAPFVHGQKPVLSTGAVSVKSPIGPVSTRKPMVPAGDWHEVVICGHSGAAVVVVNMAVTSVATVGR